MNMLCVLVIENFTCLYQMLPVLSTTLEAILKWPHLVSQPNNSGMSGWHVDLAIVSINILSHILLLTYSSPEGKTKLTSYHNDTL